MTYVDLSDVMSTSQIIMCQKNILSKKRYKLSNDPFYIYFISIWISDKLTFIHMTCRHTNMTRQLKNLTSQHKYLTSGELCQHTCQMRSGICDLQGVEIIHVQYIHRILMGMFHGKFANFDRRYLCIVEMVFCKKNVQLCLIENKWTCFIRISR